MAKGSGFRNLVLRIATDASRMKKGVEQAATLMKKLATGAKATADKWGRSFDEIPKKVSEGLAKAKEAAKAGAEKLSSILEPLGIGAGIGVAAGLGEGFASSLDFASANAKLTAQLGLTTDEAKRAGKIAASVYSHAWGDSMDQVNDAIASVTGNVGAIGDLSDKELGTLTTQGLMVAQTWGQDVSGVMKSVGALMKNGLAKDSTEAMDIIVKGFQMNLDYGGEFLDTLNEYSVQWAKLGLSGGQALQSLAAGAESGAFSLDKVGDLLKEFAIRAVDGSKLTIGAYKALHLNAKNMMLDIAKGGDTARAATMKTIQAILAIKNPVKQQAEGVALFGTQWEDLGIDAVRSMQGLTQSMSGVTGSAATATAKAGDTLKSTIEGFKRTVQVNLVRFIETKVLPLGKRMASAIGPGLAAAWKTKVLPFFKELATHWVPLLVAVWHDKLIPAFKELSEHWVPRLTGLWHGKLMPAFQALKDWWSTDGGDITKDVEKVGDAVIKTAGYIADAVKWVVDHWSTAGPIIKTVAAIIVAEWVWVKVQAVAAAIAQTGAWALVTSKAAAGAAKQVGSLALTGAKWVWLGIQAAGSAIKQGAAWAASTAQAAAGAAKQLGSLALTGAKWVWLGIQATVQAAKVAAAWVISLGPIAIVIAAVAGLTFLVIKYHKQIGHAIGVAWDWVVDKTKAAWGAIVSHVKTMGGALLNSIPLVRLVSFVSTHWDQIKLVTEKAMIRVATVVRDRIGLVVEFFSKMPGRIWSYVSAIPGQLRHAAVDAVDGFIGGLRDKASSVVDAVGRYLVKPVIDTTQKLLDSHSPSRVIRKLSRVAVGGGWVAGIIDSYKATTKAAAGLARAAVPSGAGGSMAARYGKGSLSGGSLAGAGSSVTHAPTFNVYDSSITPAKLMREYPRYLRTAGR